MRNAGMSWNAGMKIGRIVSLNSKRVCSYCSWTQASKIHCISIAIWSKRCALFNNLIKMVIHCTSTTIWSKRCALFNGYFRIFFSFLLFSQLPWQNVCKAMLRPNPLQWIAPTHQPQNHQNKAHTVIANPLHGTCSPDPLCSSFAQAHFSPLGTPLPPLWVFAFTDKLCLTSHAFWSVGVWLYCFLWGFINLWFFVFNVCVWFFCVFHDTSMWVSSSFV